MNNTSNKKEVDEHITQRYEIKKRIGKGAYGIVWKALDKHTKGTVAIKKIFDAFRNQTDAQRTFREIVFLQKFKMHPNVVQLFNIHRAINNKDMYLVFEFMETDLHHVIGKGNILKDIHKRYIMYQLCKAVKYIHSANVIHRDLKPSNILLNEMCQCKVADFGLARSVNQLSDSNGQFTIDPTLTDYVATRWYRAPEILVASKKYTKGIDMWSLGCILAEMLLGKPLFKGSSTVDQVERIMLTIEPPSGKDLESVCTGYGSSLLQRMPTGPRRPLRQLLAGVATDGLELVTKLLVFNPNKRLTASQAIHHLYVSTFYNRTSEPSFGAPIVPSLNDNIQLSVDEYRNKLYKVIAHAEKKHNLQNNSREATVTEKKTENRVLTRSLSQKVQHELKEKHKTAVLPPTDMSKQAVKDKVARRSSTGSQHPIRTTTVSTEHRGIQSRHSMTLAAIKKKVQPTKMGIVAKSEQPLVQKNLGSSTENPTNKLKHLTNSLYKRNSIDRRLPAGFSKYGYITASELQEIKPGIRW